MCVGCPNENLDIEKLNKRSEKYVSVRLVCVPSNNRTVWFRKGRGGEMPLGIYTRSICFDSGGEGGKRGKGRGGGGGGGEGRGKRGGGGKGE